MARRGRKRNIAAKRRTATTREARQAEDIGPTNEVLIRKAIAAGVPLERLLDITVRRMLMQLDISTPLRLLFLRGLIDAEVRDVGEEYAKLYWRHIGTPWPVVGFYGERIGGCGRDEPPAIDPEADARQEAKFNRMYERLKAQGWKIKQATQAVVVDGDWPQGAGECAEFARTKWDMDLMLAGLRALVDLKGGGDFS